jgi:hypothetical protein
MTDLLDTEYIQFLYCQPCHSWTRTIEMIHPVLIRALAYRSTDIRLLLINYESTLYEFKVLYDSQMLVGLALLPRH